MAQRTKQGSTTPHWTDIGLNLGDFKYVGH
jgi:hypothetical protein